MPPIQLLPRLPVKRCVLDPTLTCCNLQEVRCAEGAQQHCEMATITEQKLLYDTLDEPDIVCILFLVLMLLNFLHIQTVS